MVGSKETKTFNEKKESCEEHILRQIKKSGYPLEIEISEILDDKCLDVFNTQYYYDVEGQTGRSIDIFAQPMGIFDNSLRMLNLNFFLAVECKKSQTNSWVFYTRERTRKSFVYVEGQIKTTVPEQKESPGWSFSYVLNQHCLDELHYDNFGRIAVAYDEIRKQKSENSDSSRSRRSQPKEIFEAVNQLTKFTSYELHQMVGKTSDTSGSNDEVHINAIFPVIVCDTELFEVILENGEPKIERVSHILLGTHYRCPYCGKVESYLLDVVHRPYFKDFLNLFDDHLLLTKNEFIKNQEELVRRAISETREAKSKDRDTLART